MDGVAHVIDAKAMSKDDLYGVMDPNTREWTDGLFTSIIRRYGLLGNDLWSLSYIYGVLTVE